MADVMEFTTSKQANAVEERVQLAFSVDGQELTAYLPTATQAAMFYRLVSRTATMADRINGALEFLEQTVEPSSYEILRRRVLDPADPFDLDPGLTDILKWIADEYLARGTAPAPGGTAPAGSTQPPAAPEPAAAPGKAAAKATPKKR